MCGIIGKIGVNNVVPDLIKGLKQLEYRGYDSAGIGVMHNGKILRVRASGKIKALEKEMESLFLNSSLGIGHTRWATHGSPTVENAHPHISPKGKFALVHNGIIENSDEIKKQFLNSETRFSSDTDTEVAVHFLEKNYKGDVVKAISLTSEKLKGSFAFGILCEDFPDRIFAAARNSPLIAAKGKEGFYIASDISAVNENADEIYRLKDGEICCVQREKAEFFNKKGEKIRKIPEKASMDYEEITKGEYEHFMLKEIMEQPEAVSKTVASFVVKNQIDFKDVHIDEDFFKTKIRNIEIVACGSAYHAGLSVKYIFEELCKVPCMVTLASEFRYSKPFVNENTLAIFISQSGETADTLAALSLARKSGAKCVSIVNVEGSTMAEQSENVILTKAGREIAVATTKAYSAQLVALYGLCVYVSKKCGRITTAQEKFYIDEMRKLPREIIGTLEKVNEDVKQKAKEIFMNENIFYIGRLGDYAVAAEGSLKLKEISYINSQALPAGELKHGTISLINKGTPVIAVAGQEDIFDKTLSNMAEVEARGAEVIVITDENMKNRFTEYDNVIAVSETVKEFKNSLLILPLQLLGYYIAKLRKCDIDKPKNLAKSVTVE